MSFEELEHTADIRIRVKAATIEDLFSDAARALMNVMYGKVTCGTARPIHKHIEMDDDDLASLIRDFLSEILFLSEVEDFVISDAEVRIVHTHLAADLSGETFSREKHGGGREVKGISFSGLMINREHDCYILEVIFDV